MKRLARYLFLWCQGIAVTPTQTDLHFKREPWVGAMTKAKECLNNGGNLGAVGAGFAGSFQITTDR